MPKNKDKAKKPIFGPLGPILGAIWPQNWILHLKLQLKTVSDSILVVLWFLAENVNCCPESNPPQCAGWKAYQIVFQPIDPFLLAKNANFYKKTPKHL